MQCQADRLDDASGINVYNETIAMSSSTLVFWQPTLDCPFYQASPPPTPPQSILRLASRIPLTSPPPNRFDDRTQCNAHGRGSLTPPSYRLAAADRILLIQLLASPLGSS